MAFVRKAPEADLVANRGESTLHFRRSGSVKWHASNYVVVVGRLLVLHRVFVGLIALAIVPRTLAALAYRPALFYPDSSLYLRLGNRLQPDLGRTDGYPLFLWLLKPLHSLVLVVTVQHVLGLAAGVLIYAVLQRRGLPRWGAALATVPVLFDGREIWLEHSVLSDAPFTCCVVAAVIAVQWNRTPSVHAAAVSGALFALAVLIRPVALPLLVLVVGYLVIRRTSPRAVAAILITCLLPLGGYAVWFHGHFGRFALSSGDGIFLWSRTMSFADCTRIKPPPNLIGLCPDRRDRRPSHRLASLGDGWPWNFVADFKWPGNHLWDRKAWLWTTSTAAFSLENNDLARHFALRAITSQPLDYALIVGRDVAYSVFILTFSASSNPDGASDPSGPEMVAETRTYTQSHVHSRVSPPFALALRHYMDWAYLHGILYIALLIIGFAGSIAHRRRRRGGPGLLPWMAAVALLVLPCAMVQPDLRYVMPSIPLACLAAALAFVPVDRCGRDAVETTAIGNGST